MKIQYYLFPLIFSLIPLAYAGPGKSPYRKPAASATSAQAQVNEAADAAFLKLPAFDLEQLNTGPSPAPQNGTSGAATGGVFHVGDQIKLMTQPIEGATGALSVLPPQGASLDEQGWAISVLPPGSANLPAQSLLLWVVPLKPGKLTLPSLAISNPGGGAIARTNPWLATIESAIHSDDPEPKKPADLRPPAGLTFPWWVIAALAALGIVLTALLVIALVRWSQNRKPKIPVIQEPPKSEDVVALEALARLEKAQLVVRGDFKKYCFGISEILKTYIGARYGFDALECTSREMMRALEAQTQDLSLDKNRIAVLKELFSQLDLVKFTDQVPGQLEALQFLPTARDFVTETRKRVISASANSRPGGPG